MNKKELLQVQADAEVFEGLPEPDFDDLKNILLECDLKELPDDFPCLPDVKQG